MDHMNKSNEKVQIGSLNCDGFVWNKKYVYEFLSDSKTDILCVQETWLLDHQLNMLNTLHEDYIGCGVSGTDSSKELIRGHPPGGTAILWRKDIAHKVKLVKSENQRVCAVKYNDAENNILIVCVYMPCDTGAINIINQEFEVVTNHIENIISRDVWHNVVLCGDWNCEFKRRSAQVRQLSEFIETNSLFVCWDNVHAKKDNTYNYIELNQSSCLDHFMLSEGVFNVMTACSVIHNGCNLSKHSVVLCVFHLDAMLRLKTGKNCDKSEKILWHKVTDENIQQYKLEMDKLLDTVMINDNVIKCDDIMCKCKEHCTYIDTFCSELIDVCITAGKTAFPQSNAGHKSIPDWDEVAKPVREASLFWHWIWIECGRPRNGVIADVMRSARAKYHYTVRKLKKEADQRVRNKLAECISNNRSRDLWSEIKKINKTGKVTSPVIDDCHTDSDIANLFASKYDQLYQCVPTDLTELENIRSRINERVMDEKTVCCISVEDVRKCVHKLRKSKSDGEYGTYSDHFIYASDKFLIKLSILFYVMFMHGYTADAMLHSVLVSIPKDIRAGIENSENYRGISLCVALCKIMDLLIISKYNTKLFTSDLQFAFKEQHSTIMCTSVLKETVTQYVRHKSSVFGCLLDASKAFDRVHFGKLFNILLSRELPGVVLRVLLDCYTRQVIQTKWGGALSDTFTALNGVRQGGVLSPILFSIYFDELLSRLQQQPAGCRIGGQFMGAVCYADDVTLLCPSLKGLQQMLNVCEIFGEEYNVIFNAKKTVCCHFGGKTVVDNYKLYLNGAVLKWDNCVKHLGNKLNKNLDDKEDIMFKKGTFITYVNKLMSNFGFTKSTVLVKLFQFYCTSYYGVAIWDLCSGHLRDFHVSWNKAVRKMFSLPNTSHTSLLPFITGTLYIKEEIAARFIKFVKCMTSCKNSLVHNLMKYCMPNMQSTIGRNLMYIKVNYDINALKCSLLHARQQKEPEQSYSGTFLLFQHDVIFVQYNVVIWNQNRLSLQHDNCVTIGY